MVLLWRLVETIDFFCVKLDMLLAVRSWTTLSYISNEATAYPFSAPIPFLNAVKNLFLFTIRTCQRAGSLRSLNCCQTIMQLLLLAAPHANSTESGDLTQPRYRTPFSRECLFLRSQTAQERDREVKEPEADNLLTISRSSLNACNPCSISGPNTLA